MTTPRTVLEGVDFNELHAYTEGLKAERDRLRACVAAVRAGLDAYYALPSATCAARDRACAVLRVSVGEALDELSALDAGGEYA